VLHPMFFLSDANQQGGHVPFERAAALAAALDDVDVDIVLSTDWFRAYGLDGTKALLPKALQSRVIAGIEPRDDEKSRFDRIWAYATSHGIDSWLALDDDDWMWPEFARWRLIKPSSDHGVSNGDIDLVAYMLQVMQGGWG
jgi:hypothetical protein